jgi:hypothetical protein
MKTEITHPELMFWLTPTGLMRHETELKQRIANYLEELNKKQLSGL